MFHLSRCLSDSKPSFYFGLFYFELTKRSQLIAQVHHQRCKMCRRFQHVADDGGRRKLCEEGKVSAVLQLLLQFLSGAVRRKRAGEQRVLIVSHDVGLVLSSVVCMEDHIYLSQALSADWKPHDSSVRERSHFRLLVGVKSKAMQSY